MTGCWWKVPSVQHHQFLGSILAKWYGAKSGKGAQSRALCIPSAHSRGMIALSESGGWSHDPPSQQNQGWAGHMPPQYQLGSPWWEWRPSLLCRTCKDGAPLRIPVPASLFGFTSNCAARFLFYFKSWLPLEMIGVCSAPAVLIGLKFLGNLNTGVL